MSIIGKYSISNDTLLNVLNILGVNNKNIPEYMYEDENWDFRDSLSEVINPYTLVDYYNWSKEDQKNFDTIYYYIESIIKSLCNTYESDSIIQIRQIEYIRSIRFILNKTLSLNLVNPNNMNNASFKKLYFRTNSILAKVLEEISNLNIRELEKIIYEYNTNTFEALQNYFGIMPYTMLLMTLASTDKTKGDDWTIFEENQIDLKKLFEKIKENIKAIKEEKQSVEPPKEQKPTIFARKIKLRNNMMSLLDQRPCI